MQQDAWGAFVLLTGLMEQEYVVGVSVALMGFVELPAILVVFLAPAMITRLIGIVVHSRHVGAATAAISSFGMDRPGCISGTVGMISHHVL